MLVNIDPVMIRKNQGRLEVFLIRRNKEPFSGYWSIPGGQVFEQDGAYDADDTIANAATRICLQKTGEVPRFMRQVGFFGNRDRDPRGWSTSLIYFCMLNDSEMISQNQDRQWFSLNDLPDSMAFDHNEIVRYAVSQFRNQVGYTTVAAYLCDPYFTLTELQEAFEVALDKEIHKASFRRRIERAPGIVKTDRTKKVRSRTASLYTISEAIDYFDYAIG